MSVGAWLRSLVSDIRWWFNVAIGLALWAISYKMLVLVVSRTGYNSVYVNLVIDLSITAIWYPINRWLLFKKRHSAIAQSAKLSFAWWAMTFPLNQAIYAIVVWVAQVPYTWAKPALITVSLAEFFANYWFKCRKSFVERPKLETEMA